MLYLCCIAVLDLLMLRKISIKIILVIINISKDKYMVCKLSAVTSRKFSNRRVGLFCNVSSIATSFDFDYFTP